MINEYATTYLNVNTKYQKSEVIAKIVAEVRNRSPGGGFVKKDFYSNRWFEVGDEKARDKVGTFYIITSINIIIIISIVYGLSYRYIQYYYNCDYDYDYDYDYYIHLTKFSQHSIFSISLYCNNIL
jgi:hypothetical protein